MKTCFRNEVPILLIYFSIITQFIRINVNQALNHILKTIVMMQLQNENKTFCPFSKLKSKAIIVYSDVRSMNLLYKLFGTQYTWRYYRQVFGSKCARKTNCIWIYYLKFSTYCWHRVFILRQVANTRFYLVLFYTKAMGTT